MAQNLNNSDAWNGYYSDETKKISEERISACRSIHSQFLDTVLVHTHCFGIEVGIGTGTLGYSVKRIAQETSKELDIVEVDFSYPLLNSANNFNGRRGIHYICADTFHLPLGDSRREVTTIFHQGLLEHFSDEDINRMIAEQLRVASCVVATVPSKYYIFTNGLRGDERLMSLEQWKEILADYEVEGYYYGQNSGEQYHICLVIK